MKRKHITGFIFTVCVLIATQSQPDFQTKAFPKAEHLNVKIAVEGVFESSAEPSLTDKEKETIFQEKYQELLQEQEIMTVMENERLIYEEKIQREKESVRRSTIEKFGGNPDFLGTLKERALQEAMTQLGKPYIWGAEGKEDYDGDGDVRDGYDCSGLILWAYHRQGYPNFPRTTKGQWKMGVSVEKKNIEPGDLIYFLNNRQNKPVDHVGIYLGDGQMLHAPRPGKNIEIKEVPWRNLVTIRRIGD